MKKIIFSGEQNLIALFSNHDKLIIEKNIGKPVEKRGRKAMGLKARTPMIARLPSRKNRAKD